MISQCVGNPGAAAKWQWCCGFYPGSRPGECTNCTAATFQDAREAFEAARRIFLERRTEADFQKWREHQAWTAEEISPLRSGRADDNEWTTAMRLVTRSERYAGANLVVVLLIAKADRAAELNNLVAHLHAHGTGQLPAIGLS